MYGTRTRSSSSESENRREPLSNESLSPQVWLNHFKDTAPDEMKTAGELIPGTFNGHEREKREAIAKMTENTRPHIIISISPAEGPEIPRPPCFCWGSRFSKLPTEKTYYYDTLLGHKHHRRKIIYKRNETGTH